MTILEVILSILAIILIIMVIGLYLILSMVSDMFEAYKNKMLHDR